MNSENIRVVNEQDQNAIVKDESPNIPEIIEERRKDSDGRISCVNKYMKGRMLGKVSLFSSDFCYSELKRISLD